MWWILGGLAVGAFYFLFRRARTIARHNALVIAAQNQIRTTFVHFSNDPMSLNYEERLWRDPYLLGFIQASIALMIRFVGGSLTVEQKGMVLVDALRGIKPDGWQEVCTRISSLNAARDEEFVRGGEHGMNVVGLTMNRMRPEVMLEPDIQAALNDASRMEAFASQIFGADEAQTNPYSSAGAALMNNYLHEHKLRAEY